ncbi:MAG: hypothetical protein Q8P81_02030 [Nanoarchaeota archaeon]|nr:hypothetical protein [Nanoarchaeota archaeon]
MKRFEPGDLVLSMVDRIILRYGIYLKTRNKFGSSEYVDVYWITGALKGKTEIVYSAWLKKVTSENV